MGVFIFAFVTFSHLVESWPFSKLTHYDRSATLAREKLAFFTRILSEILTIDQSLGIILGVSRLSTRDQKISAVCPGEGEDRAETLKEGL
jgi:hypothetical protein